MVTSLTRRLPLAMSGSARRTSRAASERRPSEIQPWSCPHNNAKERLDDMSWGCAQA